jgi:hypothetical protein
MRVAAARSLPIEAAVWIAALPPLVALRLHQAQPGLLYPDGYQYLLMAKGVAEHGRPLLTLGRGGDTMLPSVDAAAKPLFPALVAVLHPLGLGWIDAARVVSSLAGACTIVLAALLARRLTGSWLAAAIAGGACIASRELAFWGGFAGPDSLGQALALGSALALLGRRPLAGGVLAAMAVLARPELALPALAAAIVGLVLSELRRGVRRAGLGFTLALASLLVILRPPVGRPPMIDLVALPAAAVLAAVVFLVVTRGGRTASAITGGILLILLSAAFAWRGAGMRQWAHDDWPLLLAGALGCATAMGTAHLRRIACALLLSGALLGLVYWFKNPDSDRYLALLTPLVAVSAGLAVVAPLQMRRAVAPAAAGLVAIGLALGTPAARDRDAFPTVARELHALQPPFAPIVTAAPDAYGVLLPRRAVRVAQPGARGLIVLDGAQRAYSPRIRVDGRVVASLDPGPGFLRPDGTVDHRPVTVVLGTVVAT